ncbi:MULTISPECIES: DNA integrity scanning diadenylate cyclase DisA [unclassified Mesotoga]|uniref:DNA integrity scanning diadenylate cyclase DisA n=1 Tax=unclassified Mesotoga TaxID=1184398 RepID=UPI000EF1F7D3|nr:MULTISPECIES: DNA integrity scanning diadenylate cyclase DisA [unclassified Mesotoga]MDI9366849.1 DNA integrity scanning diadenylate cyclase DisA [Thermotogota bacterium]NLT45409.1 DNA integrity scanning protein DisA [Thermotogaceae bacterium]MDD3680092.1 DNA integrity scanning diadenylate cyclase DisA [Mesotoga sp.]MDD4206654.1 DNA integrity scanning diadenylate cyclase DisA [Mesotoga sp.]MDD4824768.1 DNA integrity scanning diadenylate cyclase DisA [Mesotoga sp.]
MERSELIEKIKKIAPGTPLRHALDDIQDASVGGLIFFVDDYKKYSQLMQIGFLLNCQFNPNKLYELAKMDGAIVVDDDLTTIVGANVQLIPDHTIPTNQTGMRHRAAERMARETGRMLVAVSKRRNTMTIFLGDYVYTLNSVETLTSKITQTIRTAEKYKEAFIEALQGIEFMERAGSLTLFDVVKTIQKGLMVVLICEEADFTIAELGNHGRFPAMQLAEILVNVNEEIENLILDFSEELVDQDDLEEVFKKMKSLSEKEISSFGVILRHMGYEINTASQAVEYFIRSRGIRFARHIPRIPLQVAINLGKEFGTFSNLLESTEDELKDVDGIGEKRASAIRHAIDVYKKSGEITIPGF